MSKEVPSGATHYTHVFIKSIDSDNVMQWLGGEWCRRGNKWTLLGAEKIKSFDSVYENKLIFDECKDSEQIVYWLSPCEKEGFDSYKWGSLLGGEREALMNNGYFVTEVDIKKHIDAHRENKNDQS